MDMLKLQEAPNTKEKEKEKEKGKEREGKGLLSRPIFGTPGFD